MTAWAILVLAIAGSQVIAHLNARWLAVECVKKAYPLVLRFVPHRADRLREAQFTLLEIANGADDGDIDAHVARRALVYVALAGQRLSAQSDDLSETEIIEALGADARSAAHKGRSPLPISETMSLIGLVSDNWDVVQSAVQQQFGLVQDAAQQGRVLLVRELLDEATAFVRGGAARGPAPAVLDRLAH